MSKFGTFEIRNPKIENLLRKIGFKIGRQLPKTHGFALMIFGYGDSEDFFYISSGQRADMVKVMREFIAKYEEN